MFSNRTDSDVKRGFTSHPLFCTLIAPGQPPYTFPFAPVEQGWLFVAEMEKAGWDRTDSGTTITLTQKVGDNVVPFVRGAA